MFWHNELKFCIWLCFTVLQIKFECHQLVSIFVGVMPLLELRTLEILSFPHFSHTCFNIMSWNFAYDFVLLYLRQFLWELCPFWNLEYWKYTVFRTFLLRALPTCIYKFSWKLKFHVGFFNAFLLEKYYTKQALKMFMTGGRIMHRLRCSGIFTAK